MNINDAIFYAFRLYICQCLQLIFDHFSSANQEPCLELIALNTFLVRSHVTYLILFRSEQTEIKPICDFLALSITLLTRLSDYREQSNTYLHINSCADYVAFIRSQLSVMTPNNLTVQPYFSARQQDDIPF